MEQFYVNQKNTSGTRTLSDIFLERLMAWGVDTIFGYAWRWRERVCRSIA